jgi:beta-phosphoglucomutase-like phosphatase (HAD superfamily)
MRATPRLAILGRRMSATVVIPLVPRPAPALPAPEVVQGAPLPAELDTIAMRWQLALDAADRALATAHGPVHITNADERRHELVQERKQTELLLDRLGRVAGVQPLPWLSAVPVTTKMLGLPGGSTACLYDLDGVLTDSGVLHAWAWAEVFDDFLLRLSETTGWHFIPFDRGADYRDYIDGRPRLEGVHAFLASRGIQLPEGRFGDPADADTACGLARRKGDAMARGLHQHGVSAVPGARRYLEATGHAGLKRAVVSASSSTLPMLELAGLASVVEERVDADVIRAEGLRSRPAPDLLLDACRRLEVRPETAVTLTNSAAGIAAGRAAGLTVVAVGDGAQGEFLQAFGADTVVPSLRALLDPRLQPPA